MRVLVVYCHPVPESFCAAVRDTAIGAFRPAAARCGWSTSTPKDSIR